MTFFKTCLTLLTLVLISCNSSSKTTEDMAANEVINLEMKTAKMIKAGFMSGTIVYSDKENDCPYVIDVDSEDYKYMLDPVNLEESFMKDGEKIWFKFAGLRMMNRCAKANPVNIIEMQKM